MRHFIIASFAKQIRESVYRDVRKGSGCIDPRHRGPAGGGGSRRRHQGYGALHRRRPARRRHQGKRGASQGGDQELRPRHPGGAGDDQPGAGRPQEGGLGIRPADRPRHTGRRRQHRPRAARGLPGRGRALAGRQAAAGQGRPLHRHPSRPPGPAGAAPASSQRPGGGSCVGDRRLPRLGPAAGVRIPQRQSLHGTAEGRPQRSSASAAATRRT